MAIHSRLGLFKDLSNIWYCAILLWPDYFRVRLDSVAYGAAAGMGYASVLNMHFVFSDAPAPDVAAARIFANVALHVGTGMLIGYGLAELWIGNPTPFFSVYTLALSSLITGISIPVRAGLVNATLGFGISATRPLLGIIFSCNPVYDTRVYVVFFY